MGTQSLFNTPPLQAPILSSQPPPASSPLVPTAAAAGPVNSPAPGVLTEEDVKRALPQHLRASVTQTMVDTLNNISADPIMAENIRDNFVGYSSILKEGKFKADEYINAVAYVSYKLMGFNNEEAYARTFQQRYATLLAKGTSKKDIGSYVAAYHRGKMVNLIMEQSLVPTWVLNQDLFQKALNVQADLMLNSNSDKVRTDAANSLLTHLKKPEPKGNFQINLDQTETNGMKEMRAMLGQLAQQQRELIQGGQVKTIDIAASRLSVGEDIEDA